MAALTDLKITELDEKFLACEVCTERYKRPKILLCGHTFCQECLEKWAEANRGKQLTCPNCRQPWQVPTGGVKKLPANYYINNLLDFIEDSRKIKEEENFTTDSKKCESCESKAARSACLECSQLICDDCAKGHKRMRSTASHQVVSLEEYMTSYVNKPANTTLTNCDQHPGIPLEYYCQTCSIPICTNCTIIEHRVPQHKHVYLGAAAREIRSSMKETLILVTNKQKYYEEKEANIRKVKEGLANQKDKTTLEIEAHTEELVEKIRESGKKIIRKVDEVYTAKLKVLNCQLERIELAAGQVKSLFNHSQNLMELGTDAGLMSVHRKIRERLESLLNEELQVEPQVNHHLQYSPNPAFLIGKQGGVTDNKAVACQSVVKGIQPYILVKNQTLFQLVTRDIHENEVREGGAEVKVKVTTEGGEEEASDITDNKNGTYDITFTSNQPETHLLSVFLFGQHVQDSPVKIEPLPANKIKSLLPLKTAKAFGSQGTGPGQLNMPSGVTVSEVGDIFVADHGNCRIQVFDLSGRYKRQLTVSCSGKKINPWDITFNGEDHLVITDYDGKQVCVCDTDGRLLRWFGKGELSGSRGVAVGSGGHIHVANYSDSVKIFTPEGALVKTIKYTQTGIFGLSLPSVAVNSRDQVIVSDNYKHRVQVFDSGGAFLFACGRQGKGEGELKNPHGVVVDQYDNIVVCDRNNDRIQVYSPEGDYIGRVDQPGEVQRPEAIATVPGHPLKLVVTEMWNHQIKIMQIIQ